MVLLKNYKKVKYLDKLLINCAKLFSVANAAAGASTRPTGTTKEAKVAEALNNLVDVGAITTPAYWRIHWYDVKYLPDLLIKLGECM